MGLDNLDNNIKTQNLYWREQLYYKQIDENQNTEQNSNTEIVLKPYDFFIYNLNEVKSRFSNNDSEFVSYILNTINDKYVFLLKDNIEKYKLKKIPYNSEEITDYSKYIEFNDVNELINNIENNNVEFIGKYDVNKDKFENNLNLFYLLDFEYYFVSNIHNNSINFNDFKKYIKKTAGKRKRKTHKKPKKKTKSTKRKHTKKYKN